MSKKLVTSYTFDASAQTIVSADFTSLEKIQIITNVTDNIIIYNFADAAKGGALSGTTLTLDYDTTAMDDADKLQIFVEDAAATIPVTDNGGSLTVDGTVAVTQSGTWDEVGINDSGNSITVDNNGTFAVQADTELPSAAALSDSDSSTPTVPTVGAFNMISNAGATSANRMRGMGNGADTVGTGIAAAGLMAQFDDTSPGTVTENRFGNVRMSVRREVYNQIRDAAGNERGVNVNASNQLTVSVDNNPVLGAGTNAVGKLAANSGVDIGDVDVTSIIAGTGATNLGKAEDAAHSSGDTGVAVWGVRNDGANTSFSGTNADYTPIGTDAQGRIYVVQKSTTPTLSNVSSSATSVTLLSANDARIAAMLYNDSTQVCYVKFGTTASSSSFTVLLEAATYYEIPAGYTGRVDAIWASANGNMRVTEIT